MSQFQSSQVLEPRAKEIIDEIERKIPFAKCSKYWKGTEDYHAGGYEYLIEFISTEFPTFMYCNIGVDWVNQQPVFDVMLPFYSVEYGCVQNKSPQHTNIDELIIRLNLIIDKYRIRYEKTLQRKENERKEKLMELLTIDEAKKLGFAI